MDMAEPQALRPCEFLVRGILGPTTLEAFPTLRAERRGSDTLLVGRLPDQQAVYGAVRALEELGLELLELRCGSRGGPRIT